MAVVAAAIAVEAVAASVLHRTTPEATAAVGAASVQAAVAVVSSTVTAVLH